MGAVACNQYRPIRSVLRDRDFLTKISYKQHLLYLFFVALTYMLERDLAIGDVMSVCPSVRPSHAGIESKPMTVGSRSFHCRIARISLLYHLP